MTLLKQSPVESASSSGAAFCACGRTFGLHLAFGRTRDGRGEDGEHFLHLAVSAFGAFDFFRSISKQFLEDVFAFPAFVLEYWHDLKPFFKI